MPKISIVSNSEKDRDLAFSGELIRLLAKNGAEAAIICDLGGQGDGAADGTFASSCDMFFTVGGDGTFLRAARRFYKYGKPFLGINMGTLGFLAETDRDNAGDVFAEIAKGNYAVQERFMLKTRLIRDGVHIFEDIAVNDVVISRDSASRILPLRTSVNGTQVDQYRGDGVIVATPTGSTGYSLSAGGPVVEPDVDLMIVTPICPHTLLSRPFITTGERRLGIEIPAPYSDPAAMTIDGQFSADVTGGDFVEVCRNDVKLKILKVTDSNFFDLLRKKIHGGGLR